MTTETDKIIESLLNYMAPISKDPAHWYVGVTEDPEIRLFTSHEVSKLYGQWIHHSASTEEIARIVEGHFMKVLKTRGGTGGGKGNGNCRFVYAYRITTTTIQ